MHPADVFFWIVLVAIPSAVLYAVLIAGASLVIRKARPGRPALLPALASVATVALVITVPGNVATAWRAAVLDDADVLPARPIPLSGEILIDRVLAETPPAGHATARASSYPSAEDAALMNDYRLTAGCGDICRALLATPGITAVTVNRSGDRESHVAGSDAVRYTIDAPSRCGSEPDIGVEDLPHESMFDPPRVRCVASGRPVRHVDYIVRNMHVEAQEDSGSRRAFEVRLLARPVGYDRMEVTDGAGRPLFRATTPFLKAPVLPLIATGWILGEQLIVLGLPAPFSIPWIKAFGSPAIGIDRMLVERTTIRRPA